jgi:hypothetical protein
MACVHREDSGSGTGLPREVATAVAGGAGSAAIPGGSPGVAASGPSTGARSGGRWTRRWLPPQHGAWAMLLLPYLVGVVRARPAWIHLPLLVAWLAGYLLSYYLQLAVKTGSIRRVRDQLAGYGAVSALAGSVVLLMQPQLAGWALAFGPLFAVNLGYARRRHDRSLVSGLASAVQATLMVPVACSATGTPLGRPLLDGLALLMYFAGSLLYVKTMIRERGDRGYLRASITFHVVALAVAAWITPWLLLPFGWFLLRAELAPQRAPTVKQVGLLELAGSVLLAAVLLVAG